MIERHHPERYALGASLILLAGFAVEGTRVATQNTWPGFAPWLSNTVSVAFGTLWLITAVSLFARRKSDLLASAAAVLSMVSLVIMLMHGWVLVGGGSMPALLYVAGALAFTFFLKRTWDAAGFPRLQHQRQPAPAGT